MADYRSTTTEGKCIFCEIAKGNILPIGDGIFWEDDDFIACLSPFPNTEGSTFIMPKAHYGSDILKMPDDILNKFITATKKISNILTRYYDDVGRVGIIMEGTGIDHAHIKLVPMHGTGHIKNGEWKQYHSNSNKYFETYEGYISSNDGPKADEQKIHELAKKLRELKQ